jgi:uncharacterized protein YcgL (UPF0745 family)
MKLSAVYRSSNRADTYLYVAKRDGFDSVPKVLLQHFGTPQFVTIVSLGKHTTIAGIDTQSFIKKLIAKGFYLQLPPKEKNWLNEHRESLGLSATNAQTQTQTQTTKGE